VRRRAPVLPALAAAIALGGCSPREAAPPPNLLLLSVDTTRRDHLPFYGYGRDTAPRWSELARDGVVFDQAVAVNTNTAPSHGSMLTGLYPAQHGVEDNGGTLDDGVALLPELLRARGYASAAFVSAGTLDRKVGLARGFDLYRETWDEGEIRAPAERTVKAAREWLAEPGRGERPFFLFVHLYDPHYPYVEYAETELEWLGADAPPAPSGPEIFRIVRALRRDGFADSSLVDRLTARYDAEIRHADHHSGRLLDDLDGLGLAGRTVVVLLSDHGETLFERQWICDHGGRVYDEQVRIPLVVRFPGRRAAGRRIDAPVSHVDLAPTLLELAGAPVPAGLAGRSLLPLVAGERGDPARPLFATARAEGQRVPELAARLRPGLVLSVRAGGWKLVRYPSRTAIWRLYDLARDPGERIDRVAEAPGDARRLRRMLTEWQVATGSDDGTARRSEDPEMLESLRALGYLD
jgi:arylsulfatase A-like enzyme